MKMSKVFELDVVAPIVWRRLDLERVLTRQSLIVSSFFLLFPRGLFPLFFFFVFFFVFFFFPTPRRESSLAVFEETAERARRGVSNGCDCSGGRDSCRRCSGGKATGGTTGSVGRGAAERREIDAASRR